MSIIAENLIKEIGDQSVRILKDINFTIEDGEFVSISGRSGSGKSTLLYILSTLDNPTLGKLTIHNNNPATMSSKDLHEFRAKNIGFIFQFHYLLAELTAIENILLPARNLGLDKQKTNYAHELLERFEIADQVNKLPGQMSGGQQQRVAIARSLIMNPQYIFADEPTGSLDSINGNTVMNILQEFNKDKGTTIVLVTHEQEYAQMAGREIFLSDGSMISDKKLIK